MEPIVIYIIIGMYGLYAWHRIVDLKDQLKTVQDNTVRLREILYDKHQTLLATQREYDAVCRSLNDIDQVSAHLESLIRSQR